MDLKRVRFLILFLYNVYLRLVLAANSVDIKEINNPHTEDIKILNSTLCLTMAIKYSAGFAKA